MSLSLNVFRSSVENDSLGATSTIIMGAKDAIIVDPQFTLANAYRLIAEVIEMNKNIIKIFITNLHPDHILGVQVIKFFFPDAEVLSHCNSYDKINESFDLNTDFWCVGRENFTKGKVDIKIINESIILLEGHEIHILDFTSIECINVTPLWVPSIKAIVASDLVFSNIHICIGCLINTQLINGWIKCLDFLENLKADLVVPGHSSCPLTLSPSAINFSKNYLTNFIDALQTVKDSTSLKNEMDKFYKHLPARICLEYNAKNINYS
ncbi:MBL fold metallo-hydrolase (plasmid) [Pantoea allii]|uniref:MBL fold metallo-hydrolase n=1 Tax=Pantoea allii TaxID=574096 RepID=UPI003D7990FE